MQMAGSERSARFILSILRANKNTKSGILGVNVNLDVVFKRLFNSQLQLIPTKQWIDDTRVPNITGIIAFNTAKGDIFISKASQIERLKSACDATNVELVDLMLFGPKDWISLRRQNRI